MIANNLNAMVVATVTMGVTAVLMAWCFVLVSVKEWAQSRQRAMEIGKDWSD